MCIAVAVLLACYTGGSPGSGLQFEAPFLPAPSSPLALEHPGTPAVDVSPPQQGAREGAPASLGAPAGRPARASNPGSGPGEALEVGGQAREGWAEDQGLRMERCVRRVDKADVRRRLAHVSACYPAARPMRGSLRQVFNFFQQHSLVLGAVSTEDSD